jgi:hypothetical protein
MGKNVAVGSLAGSLVICLLACSAVNAATPPEQVTGKTSFGFLVKKTVQNMPADWPVSVAVTDKDKNLIAAEGWPKEFKGVKTGTEYPTPLALCTVYNVTVDIPKQVQKKNTGSDPKFVDVIDTVETYDDGLDAERKKLSLSIESIQHDPQTGWYIADVFQQIRDVLGENVDVTAPVVDATVGTADFYSLLDLNVYLFAPPPTMNLGDALTISNGQSSALPGMLFSSTPFELDSVTGLSYTPFSGDVFVSGSNTMTAVPEAGSLWLLVLAAIGSALRRSKGKD